MRLSGNRHPSALRLNHEIVAGAVAVRSKARDGAPDKSRIFTKKRFGIETPPLECAAAKIVDNYVGATREPDNHRAVGLVVEVCSYAFLVPVDRQIVGAFPAVVEGRSPAACLVTGPRSLDLDDLSAKITEHHGAERSGEDAGEVEDFDEIQEFCHLMGALML